MWHFHGPWFWPYKFQEVLHNFAEFSVVTVVILTHILLKYSLKQNRMQIFCFFILFPSGLETCKSSRYGIIWTARRILLKSSLFQKKLTFIEIIKQTEIIWVVAVYTQWCFLVHHHCCNKTFNCLMSKVLEYICRQFGLPVL